MKVLWVVNLLIPKVAEVLGHEKIPFGGWVTNMLNELEKQPNISLSVVMRANVKKRTTININGTKCFIVPISKSDRFDIEQSDCNWVLESAEPDILHVEGSESAQALRFLKTWSGENVVSMQGILNGYDPYEVPALNLYNHGLLSKLHNSFDLSILYLNKLFYFKKRKKLEQETLSYAKNILGRTHWDKAHSYFLNKKAPYYNCSRILRSGFYENTWQKDKIKRHRLFVGNSAQARKGMHVLLRAVSLLIDEYPDIEIVVAGQDPYKEKLKGRIGYRSILKRQIEHLGLSSNVTFTGVMSEEEMIGSMLLSHLYVMTSIIENSPNTLGEAMMLGMPCVSSYNGGVSDMATDGYSALFYRANDHTLLAFRIKELFEDESLCLEMSSNAKMEATKNHSIESNVELMLNCYSDIYQRKFNE
ncbi:glycosyltransferase family 4 protein [Vibrio sp. WXL210]|uniref:glycosyltransferase family 4 protein n=1 Tax=Vibrio sp. WXL210 TaxID=3450709 RepID=UPI003EC508EF